MVESDDELDIQRELDTRDSLASMARYHASSPSAITTQVLPPSFIPTATGRIRPVTGAFPAIQSDVQEKQSQLGRSVRSIRSLAAGSLRKSQDSTADGNNEDNGNNGVTPRIASSAPHYVDLPSTLLRLKSDRTCLIFRIIPVSLCRVLRRIRIISRLSVGRPTQQSQ